MWRYPYLNGMFFPFRIYHPVHIRLRSTSRLQMEGRLTIGSPNKQLACVSVLPSNIYAGYDSFIVIGHSVSVGPGVNIIVKDKARLCIGTGTYFTSDMHIEAVREIKIGSNCAISWGVTIIDSDHHELLPSSAKDISTPVQIGDHVWIGCNVTVLKGSIIGNNCVVAAGSVVKGTFPDNVLLAGNPARIIKDNINWK